MQCARTTALHFADASSAIEAAPTRSARGKGLHRCSSCLAPAVRYLRGLMRLFLPFSLKVSPSPRCEILQLQARNLNIASCSEAPRRLSSVGWIEDDSRPIKIGCTPIALMLRFLLNVLWFVLGGVVMGLGWWLAGLVAAITIVGLPWARACFVIGNYSFWPFGNEAVSRRELTGRMDFGTGPLGLIGNVIWFLVAGWWLAIGHLTSAVACFVTIIGIPFGIQQIKLALIALAPVGMQVVPVRR